MLTKMASLFSIGSEEDGATAIEYALIAALIAVVIIGSVALLGTQVSNTFNTIAAALVFGGGVGGAGGAGGSGGAGDFGGGSAGGGSAGAGGFF
jgi:pilus assembly protein Flp/PilA